MKVVSPRRKKTASAGVQADEGTASSEEEEGQREEVEEHKIHDGYALTPGMYSFEMLNSSIPAQSNQVTALQLCDVLNDTVCEIQSHQYRGDQVTACHDLNCQNK